MVTYYQVYLDYGGKHWIVQPHIEDERCAKLIASAINSVLWEILNTNLRLVFITGVTKVTQDEGRRTVKDILVLPERKNHKKGGKNG